MALPPLPSDKELALSSPAGLAYVYSRGRIVSPPHITLLNQKALDIAGGRCKRLLISMPPRHGKSEFISKALPAWYLGTFPDRRVILASYEADFASSFGAAARDMLADTAHIFGDGPVGGRNAARDEWYTTKGGAMYTAGVGGAITGKGGNLIIADDLIKNALEAQSETIRARVKDWFKTTLFTRLEPGAALIVVMTRWHEEDLIGYIQEEYPDEGWEVIRIPAIAEDNDPLGRAEGEALWPERYNEATLKSIETTLGPYWWASMYQQRPAPAKGSIFNMEWFKYIDQYPAAADIFALWWSWDCAAKTEESNDHSVGGLWAITNIGFCLLSVVKGRWEFPDLLRMVTECALSTNISGKTTSGILVEDKSAGQQIIQQMKGGLRDEQKRMGVPIVHIPVIGFDSKLNSHDKVLRARLASPQIATGKVYLLRGAPWVLPYLMEMTAFRVGVKVDDQVDMTTQFLLQNAPKLGSTPATALSGQGEAKVDW